MITRAQLEILRDNFVECDDEAIMRKVSVSRDERGRRIVTITWEDFDDSDFKDLMVDAGVAKT